MVNMVNDVLIKPIYKCGVCGTEHESIVARANCELACVKRVEEEERMTAEAKKKAEQKKRQAEVDAAYENYEKLAVQYVKDYGCYTQPWPTDDKDVANDEAVDLFNFLSFFM